MKIDNTGHLVIRVPEAMPSPEIDAFIKAHWEWITKHLQLAEAKAADATDVKKFSEQDIYGLADQALKVIPERVRVQECRVQMGGERASLL